MPPGDFSFVKNRQRTVWAQPGGHVVEGGALEHIEAVVVEAGTAVLEEYFHLSDTISRWAVSIPILVVPPGVRVVKTVAMAAPASLGWDDDADGAVWAVDEARVEEDTGTRQLSLIAEVAVGGDGCGLGRIAYHITVWLQARRYIADINAIAELEAA